MVRKIVAALKTLRTLLVMGILVIALSALNFFMGCDLDKEDPKPLYGVPPDGYQQPDMDEPQDIYVDQNTLDQQMRAYYGPVPVDVDDEDVVPDVADEVQVRPLYGVQVDTVDEVPDVVADDLPMVYYGPAPTDVVDDSNPQVLDTVQAWYGPAPVDLTESTDDVADHPDEDVVSQDAMFYYGPVPYYGSPESPE